MRAAGKPSKPWGSKLPCVQDSYAPLGDLHVLLRHRLFLDPYDSKGLLRVEPDLHAGHLAVAHSPNRRRAATVELHAATPATSMDRLDHHDSLAGVDDLLGRNAK